jgi:glycosyltransferase involved in cell wall biosynthesis
MTALFRGWFEAAVPQADALFAISRATAADVARAAAQAGTPLARPVLPVPVGSGFTLAEAPGGALPPEGRYVLFVSTLEARKNHVLLVRAWRRLLDEMPAAEVPTLVFAGRIGYMVADLMQELRNSAFLGGKIALVDHPDDAELAALYRGCLFTVFPSLYEGWGLPVTESLAFGKPCLVADATSLPEAGGALARYFDPGSVTDAVRAIRATLADHEDLRAWEAQVKREFRPVPWADMARAIVDGLAPAATAA